MQPHAHCAANAGIDLPVLLYFFPFRGLCALRKLSPHRVFIPAILLQPQLLIEWTHQCVRMKRLFSSRSCIVDIGFLTSCWPPFTTTAKPLPFPSSSFSLLRWRSRLPPQPIVANTLWQMFWLRALGSDQFSTWTLTTQTCCCNTGCMWFGIVLFFYLAAYISLKPEYPVLFRVNSMFKYVQAISLNQCTPIPMLAFEICTIKRQMGPLSSGFMIAKRGNLSDQMIVYNFKHHGLTSYDNWHMQCVLNYPSIIW